MHWPYIVVYKISWTKKWRNYSHLKKEKKSTDRLHQKQYNDTHSTRTINDEKWRIMIPHDMNDTIFNHLYHHQGQLGVFQKDKVNCLSLPLAASEGDHKNIGQLPPYMPTKQTSQ
jgi:hypothetical protein